MLTVEDVNSVNLDYVNTYYSLDTSKISEQEFNSVLYDFAIVSHTVSNNDHTFTFEVHNSLWSGGYWFTKANGDYLNVTGSYSNNTISLTTTESSVVLHLYMCSFAPSFSFKKLTNIIQGDNLFIVKNNQLSTAQRVEVLNLTNGNSEEVNVTIQKGVVNVDNTDNYVLFLLKKSDLIYNLTANVTVGIVNHIRLNVDEDYLPGGSLIGSDDLDIIVKYNDLEIPAVFDDDLEDYCVDLDLTDKIDNTSIKLDVIVNEVDLVNPSNIEVKLSCSYPTAATFNELQSQLVAGAEVIELTDNILFTNNLILPNDVYIIGDEFTVNLSSYQIIVSANKSLKVNNANFMNGQSCFNQKDSSKLTLERCNFVNASITDNGKGSVVSSNYENTVTNISNCLFHNCHHSIFTGGEVTIDNSRALFNTWNNNVDHDYSAFLTSYAGNVEITNSIFDIDYNTDSLCSDEIDVEYAQSLIGLSNETIFNGISASRLTGNDTLPFFQAPYNNLSHVFVRYYYPQIEDCVATSPIIDFEDKSACHTLIGDDRIYKNNVQVTRPNMANNIRKITWEDI